MDDKRATIPISVVDLASTVTAVDIFFNEGVYRSTKNPIYVWEFINKITKEINSDKPIPKHIREYLHRVSEKILQIEEGKNLDRQIKNATELTGNHFRKRKGEEKAYQIFETVEQYCRYGISKTIAIQKVSEEFFLDEKTVKKYYYNELKELGDDEDPYEE